MDFGKSLMALSSKSSGIRPDIRHLGQLCPHLDLVLQKLIESKGSLASKPAFNACAVATSTSV
jgi:hypothetical protein